MGLIARIMKILLCHPVILQLGFFMCIRQKMKKMLRVLFGGMDSSAQNVFRGDYLETKFLLSI